MTVGKKIRITRWFIRSHPTWLFVFGDNCSRMGLGGQAAVARGELNAFGVVTKRYPTNHESSFLNEDDLDLVKSDLDRLEKEADNWIRVIVIPGIGEGRAQLRTRAPKLLAYIKERLARYGT
jgi:hypothetical protein